jgi:hypothetical protein
MACRERRLIADLYLMVTPGEGPRISLTLWLTPFQHDAALAAAMPIAAISKSRRRSWSIGSMISILRIVESPCFDGFVVCGTSVAIPKFACS